MITQEKLKKLLSYDPITGAWTRLVATRRSAAGTNPFRVAIGTNKRPRPYWRVQISGKWYQSSRLAYLYMTGEWPVEQMDHINRNSLDDRWINLRSVTKYQNEANKGPNRNNRFGVRGCWFNRKTNKYVAQIQRKWKRTKIGEFPTLEEAVAAYTIADRELAA